MNRHSGLVSYLVDDLRQAAEDVAVAAVLAGYRLDFRPSSLWEVDRLVSDCGQDLHLALRDPNGLGHSIFAVGGYVGEVLRRAMKGKWHGDDDDAEGEVDVSLELGDGSVIWPVQRVMKLLQLGPEESVVGYAVGLGLSVGIAPRRPGRFAKLWAAARHDPAPSATRRVLRWRARRKQQRRR